MGAEFKKGDAVRNFANTIQATVHEVHLPHMMWVDVAGEKDLREVKKRDWEHVPLTINATNPTRHGVELKPRQLVLVITALAQLGVSFSCSTRNDTGLTTVSVHDSRAQLLDEIVKVMEERSART